MLNADVEAGSCARLCSCLNALQMPLQVAPIIEDYTSEATKEHTYNRYTPWKVSSSMSTMGMDIQKAQEALANRPKATLKVSSEVIAMDY